MAIRTREELLSAISARIGDDTSDEALGIIEDLTDTLADFETRAGEDWKRKYEENDAGWRKKYKERFFNSGPGTNPEEVVEEQEEDVKDDGKTITFDDLFKEREG